MNLSIYKKKIDLLKTDNSHGASFVENVLFSILIQAAKDLKRSEFKKLIDYSQDWHTVMANLVTLIKTAEIQLRSRNCDMVEFLETMRINLMTARILLCNKAALRIKNNSFIATISYSGMVYDSICCAVEQGWQGAILIAESRPVLEGKSLAKDLSKLPIDIVYGTDCQVLSMLDDVEAVFIGADAVTRSCFINKTGTKALVSTLGRNKKAYVLADMSKYFDFPDSYEIPEMPPSEVWKKYPAKIRVINKYFEKIPFKKNMVFINEYGTFSPNRLKKALKY